jgi:hypothetical protein
MYIDITEAIQYSSTNWRLTMFINPLKHNQMFITPTAEQLIDTADSMTNKAEAWQIMMLAMNYCYQEVEREVARHAIDRKRVRIIARPTNYVADDEAQEEEKRILSLNYLLKNKNN